MHVILPFTLLQKLYHEFQIVVSFTVIWTSPIPMWPVRIGHPPFSLLKCFFLFLKYEVLKFSWLQWSVGTQLRLWERNTVSSGQASAFSISLFRNTKYHVSSTTICWVPPGVSSNSQLTETTSTWKQRHCTFSSVLVFEVTG